MRFSIKIIVLLAATALIAGVLYDPGSRVPASMAASTVRVAATVQSAHPSQTAQLVQMQQRITLLESRLQALEGRSLGTGVVHADQSRAVAPLTQFDIERRRTEDIEQRQAFMAGLAQSFRDERVDPTWSASVKSRILATFDTDPALRGLTQNVDCRGHTCRVEIQEGDREGLTDWLPLLALGLGDILPRIATERVSLGAGGTRVVYLSAPNLPSQTDK
jgi:hypothetical protein